MKSHTLTIMLAALVATGTVQAADIVVTENPVSPNVGTIQEALTAAGYGGRVFVKNKAGDVPYMAHVTIRYPVEILPFDPDGHFVVKGDFTIAPDGFGFNETRDTVSIIGMRNVSGSITSVDNGTGDGIHLRMHGCQFDNGSIIFSGDYFYSHLSGNLLANGNITTREADIVGNLVNGSITVLQPTRNIGDSTMYIVGNRLTTDSGGHTSGQIIWSNPSHDYHIANNWVKSSNPFGWLLINANRAEGTANKIVNNSFESGPHGMENHPAIRFSTRIPSGAEVLIENNAFLHHYLQFDAPAIDFASGIAPGSSVSLFFNAYRGFLDLHLEGASAVTEWGNFVAPDSFDPDDITGACSDASCVDAGRPAIAYTDLDLSRNDIGTAGGSFNYNNFWPILTGGARVYLVKTPRTAIQNSTIDAEAEAYDR